MRIHAERAERDRIRRFAGPDAIGLGHDVVGDHAARLIESCGLKGLAIGGAEVSTKHSNFIVNRGGASAADIEALVEAVRGRVLQQAGVDLVPEVRIVGDA
jgi:UDP-N-acetylmuramate dehydrogenase